MQMIPCVARDPCFQSLQGPSSSRRHLISQLTASSKAWLRLLLLAGGATDPCSSPTGSLVKKHYWDPTDLNNCSSGFGVRAEWLVKRTSKVIFVILQGESLSLWISLPQTLYVCLSCILFTSLGKFTLIFCISLPPYVRPTLPPSLPPSFIRWVIVCIMTVLIWKWVLPSLFSSNTPRLMSHSTAPFFLFLSGLFTFPLSVCLSWNFLPPLFFSATLFSPPPCRFTLHFGLCCQGAIRVVLDTKGVRYDNFEYPHTLSSPSELHQPSFDGLLCGVVDKWSVRVNITSHLITPTLMSFHY